MLLAVNAPALAPETSVLKYCFRCNANPNMQTIFYYCLQPVVGCGKLNLGARAAEGVQGWQPGWLGVH